MKRENVITVFAAGSTVATGAAATAGATIPLNSAGAKPLYIRVTATNASYIKLGTSGSVAATSNDVLVQPSDSVILAVGGASHFSVIQDSAAGKVNVLPLEDF